MKESMKTMIGGKGGMVKGVEKVLKKRWKERREGGRRK